MLCGYIAVASEYNNEIYNYIIHAQAFVCPAANDTGGLV
jgi:predicted NodU family carbamoyl transferase